MSNKTLDKNLEMMKKLIEAKKEKGSSYKENSRPTKSIGEVRKAKRSNKACGMFDI